MRNNSDIYEYILDNIQKVIIPEEFIKMELSTSRLELLVLLIAEKSQTITMSKLGQRMSMPMSTATGIVDRLVKKRLVKRGSHDEDRRVVTVSLTDDGTVLVEKLKKRFEFILDQVRSFITEEEFEFALNLMGKVIAGFQKEGLDSDKEQIHVRRKIQIE